MSYSFNQIRFSLSKRSPCKTTRRGATIAPHNGVPLILQGKRDRLFPDKLSVIQ